jgi:hypothetical protein
VEKCVIIANLQCHYKNLFKKLNKVNWAETKKKVLKVYMDQI